MARDQRGRKSQLWRLRKLTPEQAAYIAGFLDGEGTIGVKRPCKGMPYCKVYITISQKTPEVLRWIKKVTGLGYVREVRQKRPIAGDGRMWLWYTNGRETTIAFLKQVKPYSIVKRKRIQIVTTRTPENARLILHGP